MTVHYRFERQRELRYRAEMHSPQNCLQQQQYSSAILGVKPFVEKCQFLFSLETNVHWCTKTLQQLFF